MPGTQTRIPLATHAVRYARGPDATMYAARLSSCQHILCHCLPPGRAGNWLGACDGRGACVLSHRLRWGNYLNSTASGHGSGINPVASSRIIARPKSRCLRPTHCCRRRSRRDLSGGVLGETGTTPAASGLVPGPAENTGRTGPAERPLRQTRRAKTSGFAGRGRRGAKKMRGIC